jgi:hypothetical protein
MRLTSDETSKCNPARDFHNGEYGTHRFATTFKSRHSSNRIATTFKSRHSSNRIAVVGLTVQSEVSEYSAKKVDRSEEAPPDGVQL